MLSQDSFYRNLTAEELKDVQSELTSAGTSEAAPYRAVRVGAFPPVLSASRNSRAPWRHCALQPLPPPSSPTPNPVADHNFDQPSAFDKEAIVRCLQELKVGPPHRPDAATMASGCFLVQRISSWPVCGSQPFVRLHGRPHEFYLPL